ncbi:MAG: PQQ-dependent sugar dehydrogenase [Saprospiraceae bacterium]
MGALFTSDGQHMVVWDKAGRIYKSTWNGTSYIKQNTPFLDISQEVGNWRDFGLLSVALDPSFDTNGKIYLYYAVDRHHLFFFGTSQYNANTNTYYQASICRLTSYTVNKSSSTWSTNYNSRNILIGETRQTGVPLVHESHAGGCIVFGSDGTLLLSTGDNGSYASVDAGNANETYWQQALNDGIIRPAENVGSFKSQVLNSHAGKVLRVDPNTGNAISSNPHYQANNPRSAQSRVWTMGLRNPFRMTINLATGSTNPSAANPGTLYIGDVGWNTWEDLHVVPVGGLNCGWPLYEGQSIMSGYYNSGARNQDEGNQLFRDLCTQPTSYTVNSNPAQRRFTHSRPALAWQHQNNNTQTPTFSGTTATTTSIGASGSPTIGTAFPGNSSTGGVFYPYATFGPDYQNTVFFADFGEDWIKAGVPGGLSGINRVRNFAANGFGNGIVHLNVNPLDNSLVITDIYSGTIRRISFGGNLPPIANASATPSFGTAPLTVSFSSAGSYDPDGSITSYSWNFGDGTSSTQANPTHVYTGVGQSSFTATLTVSDAFGFTDSKSVVISINNTAPTVSITNPQQGDLYSVTNATQLTLSANVTDAESTANMQYAWRVTLQHNDHTHPEPLIYEQNPTVVISPVGCDGEDYSYLIECTVTDQGGLSATDAVVIYPNCSGGNLAITNLAAFPQDQAVPLSCDNPSIPYDEVMVAARPQDDFLTNPAGTNYNANANYTGNGTTFEGGKIVYKGSGEYVQVTGLTGGQLYYFRVYTRIGNTWTGAYLYLRHLLVPV